MLELVKQNLRIAWDTEDEYIESIIQRGEAYLNELTDCELDYTAPGLAQNMLINYCRYDFNNALEYFEENFAKEILRLQLATGVQALKEGEPP